MKQLLYVMIGIIFTCTSAYAKDDFQCSDPNAVEAVKKRLPTVQKKCSISPLLNLLIR